MNTAVILAAGQGTRMHSKIPKVLHQVCGKAMLAHVTGCVREAGIEEQIIVVGHGAEKVMEAVQEPGVIFVTQKEQKGTGHAVQMAKQVLPKTGTVVVLCGDTPLITTETLKAFIDHHEKENNVVSVLTALVTEPYGYGRIVKEGMQLNRIVEEKDASDEEKKICEINSGMYCFEAEFLEEHLTAISTDNAQGEYYLTDLIEMAVKGNKQAGTFLISRQEEMMGVNNRSQLADAEKIMRKRIVQKHLLNGVTMINPETVYIDQDVVIERDTVIHPNVVLSGKTVIAEDCLIGINCRIHDSRIGKGTEIQASTILESVVGEETHIGPYAYLRPNSNLGNRVKIGDFVEVKNSIIGDDSKASHLAYVGDADVGMRVNIGCGVVFVNYDGVNKHRSVVEDDAFIGSNSNLIAPVVIEKNGYVAAGTTITKKVPNAALAVGRPDVRLIQGWGEKKKREKEKQSNE